MRESPLDGFQPTRLVQAGMIWPAQSVNIFGEVVDAEDATRRSSPGRVVPVTDAMRAVDARVRRQRDAAAGQQGTGLREQRLGNREYGTKSGGGGGVARQGIAGNDARGGGPPRKAKPCRWCAEMVKGYRERLKHQRDCPRNPRGNATAKARVLGDS